MELDTTALCAPRRRAQPHYGPSASFVSLLDWTRVAVISTALILFVIAFHVWAMVLEMFLWTKPLGRKTFGLSKEDAETSKTLAANQGLYNGFLAAGLLLSLFVPNADTAFTLQVFFLVCVSLAGLYGGITANMSILFLQGAPAMLALALLLLA